MSRLNVPVHAACPCPGCTFMSMLHVPDLVHVCVHVHVLMHFFVIVHVNVHINVEVHAAFPHPCCLTMSMLLHCCMSMSRLQSMSMLYAYVLAACPCPFYMFLSKLYVNVYAGCPFLYATCPCCMDADNNLWGIDANNIEHTSSFHTVCGTCIAPSREATHRQVSSSCVIALK